MCKPAEPGSPATAEASATVAMPPDTPARRAQAATWLHTPGPSLSHCRDGAGLTFDPFTPCVWRGVRTWRLSWPCGDVCRPPWSADSRARDAGPEPCGGAAQGQVGPHRGRERRRGESGLDERGRWHFCSQTAIARPRPCPSGGSHSLGKMTLPSRCRGRRTLDGESQQRRW